MSEGSEYEFSSLLNICVQTDETIDKPMKLAILAHIITRSTISFQKGQPTATQLNLSWIHIHTYRLKSVAIKVSLGVFDIFKKIKD